MTYHHMQIHGCVVLSGKSRVCGNRRLGPGVDLLKGNKLPDDSEPTRAKRAMKVTKEMTYHHLSRRKLVDAYTRREIVTNHLSDE